MTTEKPDQMDDICECGHRLGAHHYFTGVELPACSECDECGQFEKRQEPAKEDSK